MTDQSRLIEHASPLKQASLDSVHAKKVRYGNIPTLHARSARRPLAKLLHAIATQGNEKRSIEVKGRATTGDFDVFPNEWATPNPRLASAQDPFGNVSAKAKGSIMVTRGRVLSREEA